MSLIHPTRRTEILRELAPTIDQTFNEKGKPRELGFALFLFDVVGEDRRMDYISNVPKEELIGLFRKALASLEGRVVDEEGHA